MLLSVLVFKCYDVGGLVKCLTFDCLGQLSCDRLLMIMQLVSVLKFYHRNGLVCQLKYLMFDCVG